MTKTLTQHSVLVGRQPIYERDLNVAGYELLFRSSSENRAQIVDADAATSQLLVNAVVEIGLENLVFGRPAFVNFTRNFIVGKLEIPFGPEMLVVEVLETIEPDAQVIAALKQLRTDGYTIALDDYITSDVRKDIIGLADIIKVDIRQIDRQDLEREVGLLKRHPVKLLAEKVETNEEFIFCKSLGFDYYQGYFLSRPRIIESKAIPNNQLAILQLITKMRDPAVSFDELVDLIKQDIALSVKLLRYVNSLAHGVRRQIDSVRQAAVRLGLQRVCQIITLIAMGELGEKPKPLFQNALVRARMCELLAEQQHPESADIYFTTGLFSSLDTFLDRELADILKELPISPEMLEALLSHEGPMGWTLSAVLAFERGDFDSVEQLGIDESIIQQAYLNAIAWAHVETKAAFSNQD